MQLPNELRLARQIQELQDRFPSPMPREGQVWFALPESAFTQLYDARDREKGYKKPLDNSGGKVSQHRYVRTGLNGISSPWLKLFVDPTGAISGAAHFRPGAIVGHLQSHLDRAALLPGFSEPSKAGLPELTIDYRHSTVRQTVGRDYVHYGYHGIWSMDFEELLALFIHVNDGALPPWLSSTETPAQHAAQLLADVLRLDDRTETAFWQYNPKTRRDERVSPRTGELVSVRFQHGGERVPCVVVSADDYNAQMSRHLVVMQCIEFEAEDQGDEFLVALPGRDLELLGLPELTDKSWTVDLTLLRGIKARPEFVERGNPPVRYAADDQLWRTIQVGLNKLYSHGQST